MNDKKHYAYLTFHGAANEVTGANFLLEIDGKKILIDCGLHQGPKDQEDKNWTEFAYDPKDIDILLVTHAHSDHIGKIPKLVKDGFNGVIYSTEPTKEISELMFDDAIGLLEEEAKARNEQNNLYEEADIKQAMSLWKTIPYHDKITLTDAMSMKLYDAGHVLGSAMYEIDFQGKKILFTGDLGNTPTPLLRDTETTPKPHFLLMESVYGDRNHPEDDRRKHLEHIIQDAMKRNGTLMIPAFSLERTQEVLFELNDLVENGRIPRVNIYLDSPLAIGITEIYRKHIDFLNKDARMLSRIDDIFDFPGLKVTRTKDESKSINETHGPKIIIAGSGMMNGGRILHHAIRYLPEERSTLLLVGYQAAGTLGRRIYDGNERVRIFDQDVSVRAKIEMISGYSGHKGSDQLVEFVDAIKDNLEQVFCVMGEPKSQMHLAQRLRDDVGVRAIAPDEGQKIELLF